MGELAWANWDGRSTIVCAGGVLNILESWRKIQSRVFLLLCMLMNREMLEGSVEK